MRQKMPLIKAMITASDESYRLRSDTTVGVGMMWLDSSIMQLLTESFKKGLYFS